MREEGLISAEKAHYGLSRLPASRASSVPAQRLASCSGTVGGRRLHMAKSSLSDRVPIAGARAKSPRRRGRPRQVNSHDIAQLVGVRAPSLYYHFRDKDDIFDALVAYGVENPLAHAERLALDGGPAAERLYRLMWDLACRLCSAPYAERLAHRDDRPLSRSTPRLAQCQRHGRLRGPVRHPRITARASEARRAAGAGSRAGIRLESAGFPIFTARSTRSSRTKSGQSLGRRGLHGDEIPLQCR